MAVTDLKIAICISGQLRKLPMTKLHRIASALNADVYIHTWENEYNIHLDKLHQFFPDAKVAIETYENNFDKILKLKNQFPLVNENDTVPTLRYHYAQSYTVIKSFQLCLGSGKEYDLIFRARTDLDLPFGAYTKEEDFDQLIKKLQDTLYLHNKHEWWYSGNELFLDPTSELNTQPWLATSILSYNKYMSTIQDWFWIMNYGALKKLCSMSPEEAVMKSHLISKEYQMTRGKPLSEPPSLKTPSIWFKIFEMLGIVVISPPDIRVGIYRSENPNMVHGHGDVA